MPSGATLLWLALGGLLNLFNGGRWAIPLAAWLAPVFLLHFARLQSPLSGMMWLWLVLFATTFWAYRGLIPAHGWAAAAISALIALGTLLPFLADRLVAPRLPGLLSTLVFPLTWAALDFAAAWLSPYGTWGSLAYTQYGNLPLMQLAAVTGTPGITFLIAWFAAVMNWAWQQHFAWPSTQSGLLIYAITCSLAMLGGGARLVFSSTPDKTIRVATIGWPEGILQQADFMRALEPDLPGDDRARLSSAFARIHDYFLDATRREARAGAKIVVWPEANAKAFHDSEAALVSRAQQLAREENIHLLIGVGVVYPGTKQPLENKAVLIDPNGSVALTYVKAIPVPGYEAQVSRRGPPRILTHDSAHGKIAVAICYDLDFPAYIRQAGAANADLLLVPSSDWEAIKLAHHICAVFRAIENGVPMVRATRWGLSAAVDAQGRVLAQLDPFAAANQALVAQVPAGHVRTVHARFGDWFGWLCVATDLALLLWSLAAPSPSG
jgi:apolipoprotein N-acyltransferase